MQLSNLPADEAEAEPDVGINAGGGGEDGGVCDVDKDSDSNADKDVLLWIVFRRIFRYTKQQVLLGDIRRSELESSVILLRSIN